MKGLLSNCVGVSQAGEGGIWGSQGAGPWGTGSDYVYGLPRTDDETIGQEP